MLVSVQGWSAQFASHKKPEEAPLALGLTVLSLLDLWCTTPL
jgi:hypothetical protein